MFFSTIKFIPFIFFYQNFQGSEIDYNSNSYYDADSSYKPFIYKESDLKKSEEIGLYVMSQLVEKSGNIYSVVDICNSGDTLLVVDDVNLDEESVIKRNIVLSRNGVFLRDKIPEVSPSIDKSPTQVITLSIGPSKCYQKSYNLTSGFGLYKVKGDFTLIFNQRVAIKGAVVSGQSPHNFISIQSKPFRMIVK